MNTNEHKWQTKQSRTISRLPLLIRVHRCSSVLSVLCGFLFSCGCSGLAANNPDFSEAGAILEQAIANRAFPGCTVVVGTNEKILWSAAFGFLDYEDTTRVTTQTIYDLASCTKVTGTTAVFMRLVGDGKIHITDRLGKYIPEFIEAAKARRRSRSAKRLRSNICSRTAPD